MLLILFFLTINQLNENRNNLAHDTNHELALYVIDGGCVEREAEVWRRILGFTHDCSLEDLASIHQSASSSVILD